MLLELTDTLINYSNHQERMVIDSMSNILIGYYEGSHLLMASDEVCDNFAKKIKDDRALAALRYLKSHNSYEYDVVIRIKVVLEEAIAENKEINISFFQKTISMTPTKIIGENINDAYFYYYLLAASLPPDQLFSLNYIPDYGGGNELFRKVQNLVTDNNCISLIFVDSDQKYPGCKDGNTYSSIAKIYNNERPNIYLYKIPVHEVENLIPFSYLEKNLVKKDSKRLQKFCASLSASSNFSQIMQFYDIKEGISVKQILEDKQYYYFAQSIYNSLYPKHKKTFEQHIKALQICSKNEVFPKLSDNLLEKFIKYISILNQEMIIYPLFYSSSEMIKIVKDIQQLVYAYICARNSDPINI